MEVTWFEVVAATVAGQLQVGRDLSYGTPSSFTSLKVAHLLIPRKRRYILGATLNCGKLASTTQLHLPCEKSGPVLPKLQLLLRRAKIQISFLHENLLAFNFWQLAQIILITV